MKYNKYGKYYQKGGLTKTSTRGPAPTFKSYACQHWE